MKIRFDISELKSTSPELYRRFSEDVGARYENGAWTIDLDSPFPLSPRIAEEIRFWQQAQTLPPPKHEEGPEVLRIDPNEAVNRKTIADGEAALARLREYVAQGLEDSQENAAAIEEWVKQNVRGYWSAAGVDASVSNLGPRGSNVLRWKQKTRPTPAPKPEVVKLSDGSDPLPLGTSPSHQHTLAQLKDLDARTRAAAQQKSRNGWRGLKF